MRIALLCDEAAGARILQALARGPHELGVVLTSACGPVWAVATRLGYRPLPAEHAREPHFAADLAAGRVDLLLNVHSLVILPEPVLRVPPLGSFNLHPGPLPRYAGLNAPSWAIYRGECEHGVTVHHMEPGIDTGDIAYEDTFPIEAEDTGLSLALRCVERGLTLLQRLLDAADTGAIPHFPQDRAQRSYFGRGVPQGGRIHWRTPARRIYDFVRACDYHPFPSPWGTPRACVGGQELAVQRVALTGERCEAAPGSVREDRDGRRLVACADEWLSLKKVTAG